MLYQLICISDNFFKFEFISTSAFVSLSWILRTFPFDLIWQVLKDLIWKSFVSKLLLSDPEKFLLIATVSWFEIQISGMSEGNVLFISVVAFICAVETLTFDCSVIWNISVTLDACLLFSILFFSEKLINFLISR